MVQLRHTLILSAAFFSSLAIASPALQPRQNGIQKLSTSEVNSFKPFSYFAAAAYCTPARTNAWNCGTNCDYSPNFATQASGGDGSTNSPYWYVGYDSDTGSIIVGHEGSSAQAAVEYATGQNAVLSPLNTRYFTGVSNDVRANSNFQRLFEPSANSIQKAVLSILDNTKTNTVTVVGHGPGGASALLTTIYLKQRINRNDVKFRTATYALPRVGNEAFANYVDSFIGTGQLTHVNNKEDPIPETPRNRNYVQPSGEIHIQDNNDWVSCSGQDNTSSECSAGDTKRTNLDDYVGPYDGVTMTC